MRADIMPLRSYSRCPLKKRPVHFFYDAEETKDDNHEDNQVLEPENLSTKPEDLRLNDRTKSPPTAVAPLKTKRHPVEDRTAPPKIIGRFLINSYRPLGYNFQCGLPKDISSDNPTSNENSDLSRTNFPSWHHIAPHCLPYLYPYPYTKDMYKKYCTVPDHLKRPHAYSSQESSASQVACKSTKSLSPYTEDMHSQYFTTSVPLQQPHTHPSKESTSSQVACSSTTLLSPYTEDMHSQYFTTSVPVQQPDTYFSQESTVSQVACTSITSLSSKYEGHQSTDVDCLSPTSSVSSSRYNFLGTPTPPWTPEELLSPRSVSSSEGSSAGSTGFGLRIVENKSKNIYQCSFCCKSFTTYSGLSKHKQFHCAGNEEPSSKKKFSCTSCDKVYVTLGALKMHIRTHTLPCKCVTCGKAFSRPWLLEGHIRTHTGERPFSCPVCQRAFADRSNLRAHLQTHSEVKKYPCSSCGKTFSRMSLLNKHNGGGCLGPGYSSEDLSM